jgi:hypothetical protein
LRDCMEVTNYLVCNQLFKLLSGRQLGIGRPRKNF